MRIWLHLTNNCRFPIIVYTSGIPDGSPKDEVGVWDNVVADPELLQVTATGAPVARSGTKDMEQGTDGKEGKMPKGYFSEVGSVESIPPGKSILFSVPINHIGKKWHMEIPFEFDLPRGKGPRDPIVGGQPRMVVEYSISDVPPTHLSELHQ